MVHKKYIEKNGKRYGPYYYESYRDSEGHVKKRYIAHPKKSFFETIKTSRVTPFVIVFVLIALTFSYFYITGNPFTGGAVSEILPVYSLGENLGGKIQFNLRAGEFIPADAVVTIRNGDQVKQILLSELILNQQKTTGNFYLESSELSGQGEGFGVAGKKRTSPEILFELAISEKDSETIIPSENETTSNETKVEPESPTDSEIPSETETSTPSESEVPSETENPVEPATPSIPESSETTETPFETPSEPEQPAESSETPSESTSDSSSDSSVSSITGAVISGDSQIIQGTVRKGQDYVYSLTENTQAEIVPGSAKVQGVSIDDSFLQLITNNNEATISTDYEIVEEGFGENYLGEYDFILELDLSEFEINVSDSLVELTLSYNDEILLQAESVILIEGQQDLLSNLTGNLTEEIISNLTGNLTTQAVNITTQRNTIRLGEPVKWTKNISLELAESIKVDLPAEATNIVVKEKIKEESSEEIVIPTEQEPEIANKTSENLSEPINNSSEQIKIVPEIKENSEVVENAENVAEQIIEVPITETILEGSGLITGNAVVSFNLKKESKFNNWFKNFYSSLTGRVIEEQIISPEITLDKSVEIIEVELPGTSDEYVIEYETPAPTSIEQELPRGKQVIVSGPDNLNYQDVIAFTNLNESLGITSPSKIRIDWVENSSSISPLLVVDIDSNGIYDYVEWIVPHLSNQTFNIIVITRAEHLDESKIFISDIFEQVQFQDNNWSEEIPENHYVRATFERNLTSDRDITIFPEIISGNPRIEIYEKNGTEIIAEFNELNSNELNKVYLTGLEDRQQDTFDLKILEGSVKFDYITDPVMNNYYYANSTAQSTYNAVANSYQDKTTLTFTPDDSSTYLILSSWLMQGSSASYTVSARLNRTTGTSKVFNSLIYLPKDATDYISGGSMGIDTFGSSPGSQTYKIQYATSNTLGTARIKEANIFAIKLGNDDQYAQNETRYTTTGTAYLNHTILSFTPSIAGDYLIIGVATLDGSSATYDWRAQLTIDGTAYSNANIETVNAANDYLWAAVKKVTLSAASHHITIQYSAETGGTTGIQDARVVALRLDNLPNNYYNETEARATSTSTTYINRTNLTATPSAFEHLIIASAGIDGSSASYESEVQMIRGSKNFGEMWVETKDATNRGYPYFVVSKENLTSSSTTWNIQWDSESASGTAGIKDARVAVVQVEGVPDTTAPTYSDIRTFLGSCYIAWNDNLALQSQGQYIGSYSTRSGDIWSSWTNVSPVNFVSTPEVVSFSFSVVGKTDSKCIWYAKDNLGNWNSTGQLSRDLTKPTYSDISHNETLAGNAILFSALFDDNSMLHPRGQYIFSTNNTGTWVNESAVNFTATPSWANVTKTLNSTVGTVVGYRWYAKDNVDNWNSTEIFSLATIGADASNPTYSSPGANSTEPGIAIEFSLLWNDDTALHPKGQYIFSTNNTGTWVNESAVNFTATPSWANVTKTLNSTVGTVVGYRWYAKDNVEKWNSTGIFAVTALDISPPAASAVNHNVSLPGAFALFSVYYNDGSGLNPNGTYIFSTNNTGTWVNESAVNFTATPSWANVTKTLNSTVGTVVGYRWYAKDNSGNSGLSEGALIVGNPPTYSQGNSIYWEWFQDMKISTGYNCSIVWNDDIALNPLGQYILSYRINDLTPSWVNDSAVNFTSTPQQINRTVESGGWSVDCQWYAKDNAGNWNSTGIYYGEDTISPTYSDISYNSTSAAYATQFSILWNDETSLDPKGQYIFSTNNTGTWVNDSAVNFTSTPNWANVTKVLNSTSGIVIGYRWYAKDNRSNWNSTGIQTLTTTVSDAVAPTYSNIAHNATNASQATKFSIYWGDNLALHSSGEYIFSTNNTGTWVNDSAVSFTTTPSWANVTKALNTSRNVVVGYRWYAKDNAGNWNSTPISALTTQAPYRFISVWNTSKLSTGSTNSNQIGLPLESTGTYNFVIYWGDGTNNTITSYNQAEVNHTYSSAGVYTVEIEGTIIGWRFNNGGDKNKITDILQWGSLNLGNSNGYFYGCGNLTITAADVLNLTGTTTLEFAFSEAKSLTTVPSMNSWNTSSVTNMRDMFSQASSFNQDISGWNVSKVIGMSRMFQGASSFNQPIGNWNISGLQNLISMFENATSFNQPLANWNFSKNTVSQFSSLFKNATSFNQDISSWNTSRVTDFNSLFYGATSFNQPIGSWDTSGVTQLLSTFRDAISFNQSLAGWNTSKVTTIEYLFYNATNFNGNITNWDVSNVTDMDYLFFYATNFNQNISLWNPLKVNTLVYTFRNATSFNQPIGNWNTSSATSMLGTFYGATSFNQPIGNWNVSQVTTMSNLFLGVTLSASNYDNLLEGWAVQSPNLKNSVPFHGGNSKYCAIDARGILTSTHSWSITDGGVNDVCPDLVAPIYSDISHNSTGAGKAIKFSVLWDDSSSFLNPNGTYIFSTNNTGTWVNESAVNFTATPSWANVTKTLNSTAGLAIGYRWYAKDNAGNWNATGIQALTTVDVTPPIYTNVAHNSSEASSTVLFSVYWNDETALAGGGRYIFSTNNTGTWINDTSVAFSTTPSWANVTKILNSTAGIVVGYMWYANDTSNNWNSTSIVVITTADTVSPTYSGAGHTSTQAGASSTFSITWNDNIALDPKGQYIFSTNNTGSWSNDSAVNFTSTPNAINTIKTLTTNVGAVVGYRWYAKDNAGNWNSTGISTLTTTDSIAPTYSNIAHNSSNAGRATLFSAYWNDNIALNPNGRYIFSTNNTGSWVNDSSVAFSTTPSWANVTKTLNTTGGKVIGYRWYANDSANNWNSTSIATLTTVDYQMNILEPTTSNPVSVSEGENITVTFNFQENGVNLTTGVEAEKVLIGGTESLFWEEGYVLGTTEDLTMRTCSGVWGASCLGSDPGVGDYSYDGCAVGSYYGTAFFVDEVYVNTTTAKIGDTINITCDFDCYGSSIDDLAISYYNGTWYKIWRRDSGCTEGNTSVAVVVSGTPGTQKVRCSIGYSAYPNDAADDVCFDTTYADNDDLNFTAVSSYSATGWKLNVTVPAGSDALEDLFVNATYSSVTEEDTEVDSVDYRKAPTYSDIAYNSTEVAQATKFSILWNDETALNPNGKYIFSTNNTGTWVNDTPVAFSTTPSWANVTKTLNSTYQAVIGYRWYANDTNNNWNSTEIQTLITSNSSFKFSAVWNTSKTSTGSSTSSQIKLPIYNGGTYDFTVDWGDGVVNTVKSYNDGNATHTYSSPGEYTINITGTIVGWTFNNTGDKLKLINIKNWGPLRLGNGLGYFYGCSTMRITATDVLNTSGTTNMYRAFRDASNLTTVPSMNEWDISEVTNLREMFYGATNFNQNISNWNTSKVTFLTTMFYDATSFNQNINSWNTSKVDDMTMVFYNADAFNQNLTNWNTSSVTSMYAMFMNSEVFNGNISTWNTGKVTDMRSMFAGNSVFNQDIGNWNTSSVNYMTSMFDSARAFNQDISNWNTGNVLWMDSMFFYAIAFNQPIGNWNTSSVTSMDSMFRNAVNFNQNLTGWNTSKVTDMDFMFYHASNFNGNISNWNTGKITTMQYAFYQATNFNQNIGNWNVSSLVNNGLGYTFGQATSFNQNLSNWNISGLTALQGPFYGATSFNGNVTNWDTSKVTLFDGTFMEASSFNQDISNWNISSATNAQNMFKNATSFNQNISGWDTSKISSMSSMFEGATSFNQNLSNWNVSSVTTAQNMFNGVRLSTPNYDSLLTGWAARSPNLKNSVAFHGGLSKYTLAANASRNGTLIGTHSWAITDGGLASLPNITFVSPTYTNASTNSTPYILTNVTANTSDGSISMIRTFLYNSSGLVVTNNSSSSPLYWNISGLGEGTYYINATVNTTYGVENSTETREVYIVFNTAPTDPMVILNSTDGSNKTLQDLNCKATIIDPEANAMNVSVRWWKNNTLNLTQDFNNTYANGTLFNAVLDDSNTTKGDVWKCEMRLYDGELYSNWTNSSNLTILNSLPTVTLSSPPDGNTTTDRTPTFTWSGSDDDGDTLNYQLGIILDGSSTCSDPDRNITGISSTSHTLTQDLRCLIDNGDFYLWTVAATDGVGYGAWPTQRNISIMSLIEINLTNRAINFGLMNQFESNDTSDDNPLPFKLQNIGNALVNITVQGSSLWESAPSPTEYLKYKAANRTNSNSFNFASSITGFTIIPLEGSPEMCVAELNYTDGNDIADIDIYVEVPPNEYASSNRHSNITFTASLAE